MQPTEVVSRVLASPARLHTSRLVCVDGRAGSGKTAYATALEAACRVVTSPAGTGVLTVHMDDVYEGWTGLPGAGEAVAAMLLEPWRGGRPARPAWWDWTAGRRVAVDAVALPPLVILEGVGSYARRYDDLVSTLIWLECPEPVRRSRALARDGSTFAPHWDRWARDEEQVHAREGTRCRADVTVHTASTCTAATPEPTSAAIGPVGP